MHEREEITKPAEVHSDRRTWEAPRVTVMEAGSAENGFPGASPPDFSTDNS